MKRKASWGLLDRKRFAVWEEERREEVKNLTPERAIALTEDLLSSQLIYELRENFFFDSPRCLKSELKRQKDVSRKDL